MVIFFYFARAAKQQDTLQVKILIIMRKLFALAALAAMFLLGACRAGDCGCPMSSQEAKKDAKLTSVASSTSLPAPAHDLLPLHATSPQCVASESPNPIGAGIEKARANDRDQGARKTFLHTR